jgi:hypothetical protein
MQNMMADCWEFFSVDMNEANLTDSTMFVSQLTILNKIRISKLRVISDCNNINIIEINR